MASKTANNTELTVISVRRLFLQRFRHASVNNIYPFFDYQIYIALCIFGDHCSIKPQVLHKKRQIFLPAAAKTFVLVLAHCWLFSIQAWSGNTVDQLKRELDAAADPYHQIELLIALADSETNAMLAVEYAEQAIFLSDSMNLPEQKAHALHKSGVAWKIFGDGLTSGERLYEALEMFRNLNKTTEEYIVIRDLGETYRAATGYDKAIELFREALSYFMATDNRMELAATYDRMAATSFEVFFHRADQLMMDEYLLKEKEVFMQGLKQHPELEKLYRSVLQQLDSALALATQVGRYDLIFSNNIIRSSLYNRTHDHENALALLDETMAKMHDTGIKRDLPLVLINKARIIGEPPINRRGEAIRMAREAMELAEEENIRIYIFMASEVVYNNSLALGDYRMAYKHFTKTRNILDQFQSDRLQLMTQAQQYELQIRQREYEISKGRFQLQVLIIGIVLLSLLFSAFIIILTRKNRQTRELLDKLSHKNLVISVQNEELEMANKDKDRLFSIIAHDLKNPFNIILGFSKMLKDKRHDLVANDVEKYATLINSSANQTMHLLDNLLDWSRMHRLKTVFSPREVSLKEIVHDVTSSLEDLATLKDIQMNCQIPDTLNVIADVDMLNTILRNLLGNAIKFIGQGGRISVLAKKTENEVQISVTDNGVGISQEDLTRIFVDNNNRSKKGTQDEKGTGLGLILCKEFVEKHGGKIWVESKAGKGSIFTFSLPGQPS